MTTNQKIKTGLELLTQAYPTLKEFQKKKTAKAYSFLKEDAKILIPHALFGQEAISLSVAQKTWPILIPETEKAFLHAAILRVESLDLNGRIRFEEQSFQDVAETDFDALFLNFTLNAFSKEVQEQFLQESLSKMKPGAWIFLTVLNDAEATSTEVTAQLTPIHVETLQATCKALGCPQARNLATEGPFTHLMVQKEKVAE